LKNADMNDRYKYPKTLHLPWSPGLQNDDRVMPIEDVILNFSKKEIIITEKLDGENTTMYRDHIHARSVYSGDHPSRSWVKALHGQIKNDIPDGWRICGENCFAHHSIFYKNLETYFYVFGIFDDRNQCLSVDDALDWCNLLGLKFVPIWYRGAWNLDLVKNWQIDLDTQEGYVVRNVEPYQYDDFQRNVAKYVRNGHIQTDRHWMSKPVVKNLLK
jgi:hypothetical protein